MAVMEVRVVVKASVKIHYYYWFSDKYHMLMDILFEYNTYLVFQIYLLQWKHYTNHNPYRKHYACWNIHLNYKSIVFQDCLRK